MTQTNTGMLLNYNKAAIGMMICLTLAGLFDLYCGGPCNVPVEEGQKQRRRLTSEEQIQKNIKNNAAKFLKESEEGNFRKREIWEKAKDCPVGNVTGYLLKSKKVVTNKKILAGVIIAGAVAAATLGIGAAIAAGMATTGSLATAGVINAAGTGIATSAGANIMVTGTTEFGLLMMGSGAATLSMGNLAGGTVLLLGLSGAAATAVVGTYLAFRTKGMNVFTFRVGYFQGELRLLVRKEDLSSKIFFAKRRKHTYGFVEKIIPYKPWRFCENKSRKKKEKYNKIKFEVKGLWKGHRGISRFLKTSMASFYVYTNSPKNYFWGNSTSVKSILESCTVSQPLDADVVNPAEHLMVRLHGIIAFLAEYNVTLKRNVKDIKPLKWGKQNSAKMAESKWKTEKAFKNKFEELQHAHYQVKMAINDAIAEIPAEVDDNNIVVNNMAAKWTMRATGVEPGMKLVGHTGQENERDFVNIKQNTKKVTNRGDNQFDELKFKLQFIKNNNPKKNSIKLLFKLPHLNMEDEQAEAQRKKEYCRILYHLQKDSTIHVRKQSISYGDQLLDLLNPQQNLPVKRFLTMFGTKIFGPSKEIMYENLKTSALRHKHIGDSRTNIFFWGQRFGPKNALDADTYLLMEDADTAAFMEKFFMKSYAPMELAFYNDLYPQVDNYSEYDVDGWETHVANGMISYTRGTWSTSDDLSQPPTNGNQYHIIFSSLYNRKAFWHKDTNQYQWIGEQKWHTCGAAAAVVN